MTRYAVIGTGAVGGFYGSRLVQAGADVHFVARSSAAAISELGLEVVSPTGEAHVHRISAYSSVEELPRCDVVIVAVKSTVNEAVAPLVREVVADSGEVVLIQNGIDCEQLYRDALPDTVQLTGGLAFISSQKTGPNQITHFDYGDLTLGRFEPGYRPAAPTEHMQMVRDQLSIAGINTTLVEDLLLARWRKLVWNVPFNGLSVVLDAMTDELLRVDSTEELIRELMSEVRVAAAADDREIEPEFIDLMIDATKAMVPYATSMKVDADHGRELEVDAIIGNAVRRAHRNGVDVPRMNTLYQQLQFINGRIASGESNDHA